MTPGLARNSLDHISQYYRLDEEPQLVDEIIDNERSCLEKICPLITIFKNYTRDTAELQHAENNVNILKADELAGVVVQNRVDVDNDREIINLLGLHIDFLGKVILKERAGLCSGLFAVVALVSFVAAIVFASPIGIIGGIASAIPSFLFGLNYYTGSAERSVDRESVRDVVAPLDQRLPAAEGAV